MKSSRRAIVVVAATIAIQLTVGIAYIWSAFQNGVTDTLFGGNDVLGGVTFSILLGVLSISSIFGGMLARKFSTRAVVIAGGILVGIGFLTAGFVRPPFGWVLWITYGLLGGIGMGFTYSTTIACTQKWFPHKKGLITGIVIAALGIGTVAFTPFVTWLIGIFGGEGVGESNTFMILGGIVAVLCTVGGLFMVNPPENYLKEKLAQLQQECEACPSPPSVSEMTINDATTCGEIETSQKSVKIKVDEDCEVCAPKPAVYGLTLPVKKIRKVRQNEFVSKNLSALQMIKTGHFYLIVFAFLLACFSGLMIINFARPIALIVGLSDSVAFIAIVAIGLSNSAGRILWGALSDRVGRLNMVIILIAATALFAPFLSIAPAAMVIVLIGLIGLCYGGILAIFPALTADVFGSKNLATNYGFVLLGFGIGAIAASVIGGMFIRTARTYTNITYMLPAFFIAMATAILSICLLVVLKILNKKSKKTCK